MGPGFKYHIVTIAAIFFALTVGLVVGSLYVSPQIADGQKRAILGLRDTINKDVAAQKAEIERYQRFVGQATPLLLHNRLKGENVAVVQTGDYPEAVEKIKMILTQANAKIASVTHIDEAFNRSDDRLKVQLDALKQEVAASLQKGAAFPANREELAAAVASLLTRQTKSPDYLLPILEDANYLHIEPPVRNEKVVHYVIVVAGSRTDSGRVTNVDMPLIAALQKIGAKVVVCEPKGVLVSDIAAYHTLNINVPAIENSDGDTGAGTLLIALRGDGSEEEQESQKPAESTDKTQNTDANP